MKMSVTSEYFDSAKFDVADFFNQPLSPTDLPLTGASFLPPSHDEMIPIYSVRPQHFAQQPRYDLGDLHPSTYGHAPALFGEPMSDFMPDMRISREYSTDESSLAHESFASHTRRGKYSHYYPPMTEYSSTTSMAPYTVGTSPLSRTDWREHSSTIFQSIEKLLSIQFAEQLIVVDVIALLQQAKQLEQDGQSNIALLLKALEGTELADAIQHYNGSCQSHHASETIAPYKIEAADHSEHYGEQLKQKVQTAYEAVFAGLKQSIKSEIQKIEHNNIARLDEIKASIDHLLQNGYLDKRYEEQLNAAIEFKRKQLTVPLDDNSSDDDNVTEAPKTFRKSSTATIFANLDVPINGNGFNEHYSRDKLFSKLAAEDDEDEDKDAKEEFLISINYPTTKLTEQQREVLASEHGLAVTSPAGIQYQLINQPEKSPQAYLKQKEVQQKNDEPDDIFRQRIAVTIINMIDNIVTCSKCCSVTTYDPFIAEIATLYLDLLKKQDEKLAIESSEVNFKGSADDDMTTKAQTLFEQLNEKSALFTAWKKSPARQQAIYYRTQPTLKAEPKSLQKPKELEQMSGMEGDAVLQTSPTAFSAI